MTIVVRVAATKAMGAMRAMTGETVAMENATKKAAVASTAFGNSLQTSKMMKFGNQLQWTGRQLQYNFTLPIALAGAAATKFALDNEKAFTRVKKVYGDTAAAAKQFRAENHNLTQEMAEQKATRVFARELDALQKAFVAISNQYGVQQKEVLEVASAWAAAGASGRALAESVNLTMKAMIVGDLDSAEATKALIAIQAQYNLNTKELNATLAQLNAIENQTAITTGDLIQGFERTAGVAREAGIDTRHLGAFLAALVPAAGSAATAGNALKTIISRLLSPTGDAAELMEEIGLKIKSTAWQSANGTERLLQMSEAFNKLSGGEQAVISSTVASRYQINRFSILMQELAPHASKYEVALKATASQTEAFAVAQRELNAVLQSNPQKMQQAWVMLQNALAQVIIPILPHIIYLVQQVAQLATAFANLSPEVQKFVLIGLVALALVGPLVRYMGSLSTLIRVLAQGFVIAYGAAKAFLGALIGMKAIFPLIIRGAIALGTALAGPWGIALAAVIGLLVYFRDDVVKIFNSMVEYIIKAFYALPQGVQNAMIAVARVVQNIALQIYEWLQYINPFAQHSPSIVQNVVAGMAIIRKEFNSLKSVSGALGNAQAALQQFNRATADLRRGAEALETAQNIRELRKADPGVAASYQHLANVLQGLQGVLRGLEGDIRRQEAVVARWQSRVDAATNAIERQQAKLDRLNKVLETYQDKLSKAQERLDYFANAPLKGMDAMEDKIFANEMAQKRLRLEIMRLEDTKGTLDDVQQKMADIAGAQELLRGEKSALRSAGAGSEILKHYDDEIHKLDQQKDKFQEAADKLATMQLRLEDLQRQAEKLDLVKSLKFDVLQHKIDEMVDTSKELTFQQIVNGIKKAQDQVKHYTKKVDQATAAVNHQQNAVDAATKHRDKLQKRLDKESDQLTKIQDRYDKVNDAIQRIEQSLSDAVSMAQEWNEAMTIPASVASKAAIKKALRDAAKKDAETANAPELSPAMQAFQAAGKGDFPDVGGTGIPKRKDWRSQVPSINEFTEQLANQTASMFDQINPFAGFGGQAGAAFGKVSNVIKRGAKNAADWLKNFWNTNDTFQGVKQNVKEASQFIGGVIRDIGRVAATAWRLFGPEIIKTFEAIGYALQQIWIKVLPEVIKFKETVRPIGQMIKNIWTDLKPFLAFFLAYWAFFAKLFWSILNHTLRPAIDMLVGQITGALRIVRGVIKIIAGVFNFLHEAVMGIVSLFTGDWADATEHFKKAGEAWMLIADGIKDVFSGAFLSMWSTVSGVFKIIIGGVKGFVNGIVDFFVWLWDALVGHSIIPDMMHAIVDWFLWLPKQIFKFIGNLPENIVKVFVNVSTAVAKWADKWLGKLKNFFTDLPGNIYDFLKKLPGRVWDAFWKVTGKIGEWEVKQLKRLKDWFTDLPGNIYDFLKKLPGRIWDAFWKVTQKVGEWEIKQLKKLKDWFTALPGKIFDFLKKLPGKVWDAFMNVSEKVGAWEIRQLEKLKNWFSSLPDKVSGWLSKLPDKIGNVFEKAANAAGRAFEKIKNAVKQPINWVITNVINKGLIRAFNWVSGKVNGPHIDPVPRLKSGGVLPGYTPGRDTMLAAVSGGEAVMRPEWTRAVGKKNIDDWNRTARVNGVSGVQRAMGERWQTAGNMQPIPHFAKGGRVWPVGTHYWTSYPGHDGMDFPVPRGTPIHAAAAGRTSYVGTARGYGIAVFEKGPYGELVYGHMLRASTHKGERLSAGEVIGYVDSTGNSTGNHLHFGFPGSQGGTPEKARAFLEGASISHLADVGGGGGVLDFLSTLPGKVQDALKKPFEYLKSKLPNLDRLEGYKLGEILKSVVMNLVDSAGGRLQDLAQSLLFTGTQPSFDKNGAIALARQMVPYEWSTNPDQWNSLLQLWQAESGWNTFADNPTSSAYGIPQALVSAHYPMPKGYYDHFTGSPHSSNFHGFGGSTAVQLKWGINYIKQRYGDPASAWAYWQNHHSYKLGGIAPEWYGDGLKGGIFTRPTLIGVGDKQPERVDITPIGRGRNEGRELHFHGDLSFPNITDPNDAERFIRNLESLAGGVA